MFLDQCFVQTLSEMLPSATDGNKYRKHTTGKYRMRDFGKLTPKQDIFIKSHPLRDQE